MASGIAAGPVAIRGDDIHGLVAGPKIAGRAGAMIGRAGTMYTDGGSAAPKPDGTYAATGPAAIAWFS